MPRDLHPLHRRRREPPRTSLLSRRRLSLLLAAAIVGGTVALLFALRGILFPFVVAGIIAYVLEPSVRRIARYGVPRWVGVIVTYVLFFGSIYGFSYYLVPKLQFEGRRLLEMLQQALVDAPAMYEDLERRIESFVDLAQPAPTGAEARRNGGASDLAASQWGFGPPLHVVPGREEIDVPALEPASFVGGDRAGGLGALVAGAEPARPTEALEEGLRRSNIVVEQLEDGVFGVRLRESTFDVESVGEGTVNITPRSERATQNKLKNLQAELVGAIKRAMEQLGHGMLGSFLSLVRSLLQGLVGAVIGVVLMFMVAAFLLIDMEHLRSFFRTRVPPRYRADYDDLVTRLDRGLSGVVRGQLMICLVNGTLSAIGFLIFIPEYAIVLAVFAGALSLIPIFGTIISSVPAVLVGLTASWGTAVAVLAWILGIHFIEANILNPKIIGSSAKINPVVVIFVLIAGEHTYGLAGALLAVPATSVVQSLVGFTYDRIRPYLWGERR